MVKGVRQRRLAAQVPAVPVAVFQPGYGFDVLTSDARRFTPQNRPRVFLIGASRSCAAAPLRTGGLSEILESPPPDDPWWWSETENQRHLALMSPADQAYVMRPARLEQKRAGHFTDDPAGCPRTAGGGGRRRSRYGAVGVRKGGAAT